MVVKEDNFLNIRSNRVLVCLLVLEEQVIFMNLSRRKSDNGVWEKNFLRVKKRDSCGKEER